MKTIRIKKGLNLPISGDPVPAVFDGPPVSRVAVTAPDFPGMKPKFLVETGDKVTLGQPVFTDKKCPELIFTSPGAGIVAAVNRGAKRAFLSLEIDLTSNKAERTFSTYSADRLSLLKSDKIRRQLLDSGLWTAFRTRPYGRVADPSIIPHSIFVTAMDTNPLAPDMAKIIEGHEKDFLAGLDLLVTLSGGKVYVCHGPHDHIPVSDRNSIEYVVFDGPHPAGLPGTHIHFLDPVHRNKHVFHIGMQDVIAVGKLFTEGRLWTERVVSMAGPGIKNPRMIRTCLGASITDLTRNAMMPGIYRLISGSVYAGHHANGPLAYLGRYHQQIVALPEDTERRFLGWLSPGRRLFSLKRILASSILPASDYDITTNLHGGRRSIVPVGSYEKVMPLDIQPTYLLRALAVDDIEEAEKLGCMELIEEDLGLVTFACPSKIDHMANLRRNLTVIEKEG